MSLLSGNTPRRPKRGGSSSHVFTSGPWKGVWDSGDSFDGDADYLIDANDCWFRNADVGGGVWARPLWNSTNVGALGGVGARTGQCVYEHTRPDGTTDRIAFCGGKMYSWDGTATFTDITPGAVTISTTARIFCCTFAGLLIVSDGTNKPWTYNPATTTAAVINADSVPSAWSAFGQPVVYGGKLFFIMQTLAAATYRNRIIWSEEAAPTTGYAQTGFTNFWELSQTDPRPLYALAATNAALYYFRAHSIGAITGTVNPAFQTTATHDAISLSEGTTAPASVVVTTTHIWFVDILGRVHRFAIGTGTVEPVWRAMQAQAARWVTVAPSTVATAASGAYSPDLDIVLFSIFGDSNSSTSTIFMYAFDARTAAYQGYWTLASANRYVHAIAVCSNASGYQTFCVLGSQSDTPTDAGFFYRMSSVAESGFPYSGGSRSITTRFVIRDPENEWIMDTVEVHMFQQGTASSLNVYTMTSLGTNTIASSVTTPLANGAGGFGGAGPSRLTIGLGAPTRIASFLVQDNGSSSSHLAIFDRITVRARRPASSVRIR